jgi:biopolymer transport protein ExbD
MSFSAGGGPSAPQMNVTPLIDVLLVLLIIFMLVVIQEKPKGFDAQIPQQPNPNDHSVPPPETTIIIQVRDGKSPDHPDVKINNEQDKPVVARSRKAIRGESAGKTRRSKNHCLRRGCICYS